MQKTTPLVIETPRLFLREFTPIIGKQIFEHFSDQEIMDYFGLSTIAELQVEQDRYRQGYTMFRRSFNYFHLILKNSDTVIGWCGFHTIYTNHDRAELGYVLNQNVHKGCGYMKEALPYVLKHGFENLNLHRIEALISEANTASYKLLAANNFVKEGVLKEHYLVNDVHEDSVMYALLKTEFMAGRN